MSEKPDISASGPAAAPAAETASRLLREARRIVVKLGTNVICRPSGELALGRVYSLIEDVVDAYRRDREIILVSSGAIGLGMGGLALTQRPTTLDVKQACAAVGQIRLMSVYQQALDRFRIPASQVLLTEDDFSDRRRYLNLRNTLNRLLRLRSIPIVNENDTTSTSEIETQGDRRDGGENTPEVFGDNDVLSALVASKLRADLLIMLSDVDGLHDEDPATSRDARRIPIVSEIGPEIEKLAERGPPGRGRGGMRTKLRAARIATVSGTTVAIARGAAPGVLRQLFGGEPVGTCFLPGKPMSSRKRWIAFASSAAGGVRINAGARKALLEGQASLLFAGILTLESEFRSGDIVSIRDESGAEFARGIANYSSEEAGTLIGRHSSEVSRQLSGPEATNRPEEFVHRDTIVIL